MNSSSQASQADAAQYVQDCHTEQPQEVKEGLKTEMSQIEGESERTTQALNQFHLFPKLPLELQDMVWERAVLPQIFQMEPRYLEAHPKRDFMSTNHSWIPIPLIRGLENTCKRSRVAAQRSRGNPFVVVSRETYLDRAHISSPFPFDPAHDTIYFADIVSFCLWQYKNIFEAETKEDVLFDHAGRIEAFLNSPHESGFEDVASLTMSNVLQRAVDRVSLGGQPPYREFDMYPHAERHDFVDFIRYFPNLRELIMVSPTVAALSEQAAELSLSTKKRLGSYLDEDTIVCQERIERLLNECASTLKEIGLEMFKHQKNPINAPSWICRYPRISDWWKNPVITWLTEQEFESRFGMEPGSLAKANINKLF